jgi:NAD(P)-dependent dehydrogenase (short-subunit alcohol dehydrogenase family)
VDFSGKVALVTGASRNLGAAIATRLGERGAQVAVHYNRNADRARQVAQQIIHGGGIAEVFGADLADADSTVSLAGNALERFGRVDILINNVGPYSDLPFTSLPVATWNAVFNSNVRAPYLLAQHLAPGMRERRWGRIVNISAVSALLRAHSIYGLSKAALLHLTECLALELAPEVAVNAIAPGQIEESEEIDVLDPTYKARLRETTPTRRLVSRTEIADMVCLLCSDEVPSLTGQTLVLDGGWSLPVGRSTPTIGTVM